MIDMWKDWNIGKIFEDIDKEFATREDMFNRMFRMIRENNTSALTNDSSPFYYGYQVLVGRDGKPHVREFGNVRPSIQGLVEQSGTREPLVDTTFNKKDNIYIITAEMPGVTKEDIKVNVSDKKLTIKAERNEKKYYSEIPVDLELDTNSVQATYSNGILELKVKPKEHPKSNSKDVKVE